jgi:hypothetical protein
MRTADLTGAALDWAVAKCEGTLHDDGTVPDYFQPSVDWEQGGVIIECERIQITPRGETTDMWEAIIFDNIFMDDGSDCFQTGPTSLIAAMRCYVASKLGKEIELPEELMTHA